MGFLTWSRRCARSIPPAWNPLAHPVASFKDISLRLREDRVSEPNNRDANQRSAPVVEHGLFLVPKVIE